MPGDQRPEPSRFYRWAILIVVSLAVFGSYYVYDALSPLADVLKQQLGFSDSNIGLLQAIYSFPNIFTVVIGGFIIDRLGIRKSLMIFGILCLIGPGITAMSGKLWIMATGRLIFGMGAESLIVGGSVALARWFKGKELSFAFGINLTIARLASVAADNSPTWANRAFYPNGPNGEPSWQGPLVLAVGAGVLAVVCSVVYWGLESHAEGNYALGQEGSIDKLEFNQIFRFNRSYWYVVALCFTFYSAIFPFRTFAIDFFTNKILASHGGMMALETMRVHAHEQAGFFNSLLPLSAMIATPLFGLLSDKIGKRAFLMMFGSFLLMPVYLLMAYSNVTLFVPVCMMGIAFSLIPAVMWPSVAYIVDQSRLGTAYALMTMIQQIGFFLLNLLIGNANDYSHAGLANPGGYALGMWIFSILGFVGLTFAILLRIRETGPQGHGLETITAKA